MHPTSPDNAAGAVEISDGAVATAQEADPERERADEAPERAAGGSEPASVTVEDDITPLAVDLEPAIEAICMVVDDPVQPVVLAQVLGRSVAEVLSALRKLSADYTESGRGFELREVPGGWRFYSRPEFASAVERFVLDGQQARLTQASLETLAVVAYRQPISRSRVSAVRGVNVDGVMRTLLARGLVEEAGTEEGSGATLYRTSGYFLERLGLRDVTELPELAPLLPDVEFMEFTDD